MEDFELKPMLGVMMVAMFMSIIPGMMGTKPGPEPEYASIQGTVSDGDTDPLTPLSGAVVQLVQTGEAVLTGSDGTYGFGNLQPGNYTLAVSKSNYHTDTVPVYATEPKLYTKNVVLMPVSVGPDKANLSGTVRSSVSPNNAISGVSVKLYDGTVLVDETTTGIYGVYSFSDIDPGSYSLTVDANGYEERNIDVDLEEGNNTQDIYLDPEGVGTADFEVSNLIVNPTQVNVGETVNIGATVTNIGDATGTCVISTDPSDDPNFLLEIGPGQWTPAAVVPTVYRPAFDITPIMSAMTMLIAMTMMVRVVSKVAD